LFFPFKGILVVYDRRSKEFASLPGADDPLERNKKPVPGNKPKNRNGQRRNNTTTRRKLDEQHAEYNTITLAKKRL